MIRDEVVYLRVDEHLRHRKNGVTYVYPGVLAQARSCVVADGNIQTVHTDSRVADEELPEIGLVPRDDCQQVPSVR